ncbi:MAG: cell division protein ZapA [Thiobacillaceae bacterium]
MAATRNVEVTLMGRSFKVPCSPEEEPALMAAVNYLNSKMREIRDNGKVVGTERIAMMAGLNIAHELLSAGGGSQTARLKKLEGMKALLDGVLDEQNPLF